MEKRYLVLTDNDPQYIAFKELLEKDFPRYAALFDFKRSPESKIIKHYEDKIKDLDVIKVKEDYRTIIERYTIVFSLHCKQIFPKELVKNVKCINIHPGYNPINRGWYPQVFAIMENLPIGATIHEMDEYIDHGNIIDRQPLKIYSWETSKEVYDRILTLEIELIKKNLLAILNNEYTTISPDKEEPNIYHSRTDFKNLCQLKLDEPTTVKDVINLLRATTHGDYANSFFIDEKGNKVFVKITLEKA
jgi:methionyl-tRNA formyltransferase